MRGARLVALAVLAACGSTQPARPAPPPFVVDPAPAAGSASPQEVKMEPPHQTAQPQDLVFPDEDFRKTQPVAGRPHPFTLPKVQHFTLGNGIAVYLVEQHALPLVSMDLNFDGGDRAAPHDKPGLVGACMAMLTEGTDKLDKLAYAEALADVASTVNAYANDDSHGVMLSSLTKHLDHTFELFAATLRTPGFRQRDFDRLIKRRIEGIKQAKGTPQQIAPRVIAPVLYGRAHPLGAVTTEASLGALALDDCKHFATSWLAARCTARGCSSSAIRPRRRSARASSKARSPAGRAARPSWRRCRRRTRWPAGSSSSTCRARRSRRSRCSASAPAAPRPTTTRHR